MKRTAAIALVTLSLLAACDGGSSSSAAGGPSAPAPATLSAEEVATRVAALAPPYNEGDYQRGQRVAGQCRSCHTFTQGGRNLVGPNLGGLFGRRAGSQPGFSYSRPLQQAGFDWNEDRLDHWLTNPREFLPGNRMAFPGVRTEEERRDLITFLHIETTR